VPPPRGAAPATRAGVPSGASTGTREALELRDGDKKRLRGKGVLKAVENVDKNHRPRAPRMDARQQVEVDRLMIELDGTDTKSKLGANAILGVSMAVCRAAAEACELPLFRYVGGTGAVTLPVPMMNVINGGAHRRQPARPPGVHAHAGGLRLVPRGAASGAETFHALKSILKKKGLRRASETRGASLRDRDRARGARPDRRGDRRRRLQGRRAGIHRPRPGRLRVTSRTASTSSRARGRS